MSDFNKKAPTKTEKMIFDLAVFQQEIEKNLWSTSQLVLCMALANNLKPEDLAELMINGGEKLKEFTVLLNNKMKDLVQAKNPPVPPVSQEVPEVPTIETK